MYAILLHAHQKIDRTSYKHLQRLSDEPFFFPSIKDIIHFEGRNGPDATKLKNKVSIEQPWHFVDPFNADDTQLHGYVTNHYDALVSALKVKDEVKCAFEAAWLAHALVDGLTPAHHYPYEEELELLRGEDRRSRKGLVGRAYVKGETRSDSLRKSLLLVGPKGLLTNHAMFEGGAYTIMRPLKLGQALPRKEHIEALEKYGVLGMFQRFAREIGALDMYGKYSKAGWTPRLIRQIRRELAPRMVMMVTLAWYAAAKDAGLVEASA